MNWIIVKDSLREHLPITWKEWPCEKPSDGDYIIVQNEESFLPAIGYAGKWVFLDKSCQSNLWTPVKLEQKFLDYYPDGTFELQPVHVFVLGLE